MLLQQLAVGGGLHEILLVDGLAGLEVYQRGLAVQLAVAVHGATELQLLADHGDLADDRLDCVARCPLIETDHCVLCQIYLNRGEGRGVQLFALQMRLDQRMRKRSHGSRFVGVLAGVYSVQPQIVCPLDEVGLIQKSSDGGGTRHTLAVSRLVDGVGLCHTLDLVLSHSARLPSWGRCRPCSCSTSSWRSCRPA